MIHKDELTDDFKLEFLMRYDDGYMVEASLFYGVAEIVDDVGRTTPYVINGKKYLMLQSTEDKFYVSDVNTIWSYPRDGLNRIGDGYGHFVFDTYNNKPRFILT